MAETQAAGRRKELIGNVVSNRMNKTIVVQVVRQKAHPLYTRVISKAKKFYAHDEKNEAHIGDVVRLFGILPILGSSSRGGAAGLRNLLAVLRP